MLNHCLESSQLVSHHSLTALDKNALIHGEGPWETSYNTRENTETLWFAMCNRVKSLDHVHEASSVCDNHIFALLLLLFRPENEHSQQVTHAVLFVPQDEISLILCLSILKIRVDCLVFENVFIDLLEC